MIETKEKKTYLRSNHIEHARSMKSKSKGAAMGGTKEKERLQ